MWENLLVVTGSNPLSVLMIFLPNLLLILLFPSTYFCVMRIRNLYKHNYSKLLQISNNRKQKNTCGATGNTDVAGRLVSGFTKCRFSPWDCLKIGFEEECLLAYLFVCPFENDHGAITRELFANDLPTSIST